MERTSVGDLMSIDLRLTASSYMSEQKGTELSASLKNSAFHALYHLLLPAVMHVLLLLSGWDNDF